MPPLPRLLSSIVGGMWPGACGHARPPRQQAAEDDTQGGNEHAFVAAFVACRPQHANAERVSVDLYSVPLGNIKLFISGSCPILVLTKVLCCPRRADAKNDVKSYQGPTTSRENTIRKYSNFLICFFKLWCDYDLNLRRYFNPELPPMRDFGSLYFINRHTFVCGTVFPEIKLNRLYPGKTKLHIQKCNTCRDIEKQSRTICCYYPMVQ